MSIRLTGGCPPVWANPLKVLRGLANRCTGWGMDKEVWRKGSLFFLSHPPTSAQDIVAWTLCKERLRQTVMHVTQDECVRDSGGRLPLYVYGVRVTHATSPRTLTEPGLGQTSRV